MRDTPPAPRDEAELEERLATPTPLVLDALRRASGDVIVLGAGGKMGPSIARMAHRAARAIGDGRRVMAVSRFSDPAAAEALARDGIEPVRADLAVRAQVDALPDAPNVLFLAGQKFGTAGAPEATWAANALVPAHVAERYAGSRIVAFSTGNVYPLRPVASGGAREEDAPAPVGEYAWSCLARERIFAWGASARGTPVALVRLNYAVDLRYGVLVDLALRVWREEPVDVTMGFANVIWQGDANAWAIACLPHAASPAFVVNVTGPETVSIRESAMRLGHLMRRTPRILGREADDALLSRTERARSLFGAPTVPVETLERWVAEWIVRGGRTLGKPTRFEVRDGRF